VRETILVTDGDQRAALALVRAFGRAGHRVLTVGPTRRTLAGASRFVARQAEVPDPLQAVEAFTARVVELCRAWGVTALVPVTEPSALALLGARGALSGILVPFADLNRFRAISDKLEVLRAAGRLGIAVPAQQVVAAREDRAQATTTVTHFPVVLKPARSVAEGAEGRVKLSVRHARDASELALALEEIPAQGYPVLLQQRVVGPGLGIFLLRHEGRTVARFAHRRLREKPPSGGVSVYRESVPLDASLLALSEALLAEFDWTGVAMVEFKVDRRSGIPYLMEINGRFWGSLQLAVDAGVDFPNLLLAAARGLAPAEPPPYASGVRLRWWWGEVDHLVARLRHSDHVLHLPPGEPTRWRALAGMLLPWRPGDRPETFRLNDPAPFLRETLNWFQGR